MSTLSLILVALVGLLHAYICWFEMFRWEERGPRVFTSFPKDLFRPTKALAANLATKDPEIFKVIKQNYFGSMAAGLQ